MNEKRKYHRLKNQLPVSFQNPNSKKYLSQSSTLDIGAAGLCLTSEEKLSAGDQFKIKVTLPDNERLIVNARAAWVKARNETVYKDYLVGIEIVDQRNSDEVKFIKYYANQLSQLVKEAEKGMFASH